MQSCMSCDANPFRLLVFDWDGTLMDSVASIVACAQAALDDLGLPAVPEPVVRGTVGLGLRETMDVLCPGGDEADFNAIVERYRHHWYDAYRDLPVLFSGVEEMLASLAAEDYLLAVATGKSRRGLEHALAQTGLAPLFHATRTADEAFSKPHPQMLLEILADLGVPRDAAVMIGDTTYDLEMAKSAGTAGVGVCSGSHCRAELERLGPLACLDAVLELPGWLAGISSEVAAPPSRH
jgi:phosphoglycolate phosphatase